MKVQFNVFYHTRWGQQLFVCSNIPQPGNGSGPLNLAMTCSENGLWTAMLDLPVSEAPFNYYYIVREPGMPDIFDAGISRSIVAGESAAVVVFDAWNGAEDAANVFYTQLFGQVLLTQQKRPAREAKKPARYTHRFTVRAPLLGTHETVCLLGDTDDLRNWDTANPILMQPENGYYVSYLKLASADGPLHYKYGIYNKENKLFREFETGANRSCAYYPGKNQTVHLNDGLLRTAVAGWRGAGVAIPVFSLRSAKSFGAGEFSDIPLLADWAAKTGIKLLQLLPLNDTTAHKTNRDSYPYAANSAFALHPLFLRLDDIGTLPGSHKLQQQFERKKRQLNKSAVVEYEDVMKFKLAYLEELYRQQKEALMADQEFIDFFESSKDWLQPYAAFSYLRDKYKTPDFTDWKKYALYDAAAIAKLCAPGGQHYEGVAFWYFVQYHLHVQLKRAVDYAHQKGVALKGDIPIGVDRHSCDAWMAPSLYNMDMQAGAPPDDFAVKGQNWGFPTYNWQQMQQDGFAWWKRRFEQLSNYFDAFRIDHILGFFRIWSIPMHAVEGIMGRFVPAIAVHIDELHQRNIGFDYDRFCRPYITNSLLWQLFDGRSEIVKAAFLDHAGGDFFSLKPEFSTQRQIEAWFAAQPEDEFTAVTRQGLYDLVSNVILFEEPGSAGSRYHFRIGMDKTYTFSQLDWHVQQQLKDLYINYFYRRQDDFWKQEALNKLPALKHTTNMLVCGEDLGMVPGCVADVMHQLSILGLEVQRMPKQTGVQFTNLAAVPWLSVVTPSSHDMSTIRGWWEEDRQVTQTFYNESLGQEGEAPLYCEPQISRDIILQHLQSPAMWSIFQLQDLLGIDGDIRRDNPDDERINVPADPNHFWCYRMHIKLEDLLKAKNLNAALKEMIGSNGR